jgi:hypothetical protein
VIWTNTWHEVSERKTDIGGNIPRENTLKTPMKNTPEQITMEQNIAGKIPHKHMHKPTW